MLLLLTASGLSLAAIASLYKSWRARAPAFAYSCIMLFSVSCVVWSLSQGWEYGLVYSLCLPGLLVWLFIGANQIHVAAPKNTPAPRQVNATLKRALTHTGHMVVVLPGLMVVSLLIAMAVSLRMPTAASGQLATGIALLPVIWGLLVYHYLATNAKVNALVYYVIVSAISALMLLYLPGLT